MIDEGSSLIRQTGMQVLAKYARMKLKEMGLTSTPNDGRQR